MAKRSYQCRHCRRRYVPTGNGLAQKCEHCGKVTSRVTAKRSDMVKLADDLFSLLVRYKGSNSGRVACCTCGRIFRWQDIQCGHFVRREEWSVRYSFRNAHPQCETCNKPKHWGGGGGREWEHGKFIDETHGPGTAENIKARAKLGGKQNKERLAELAQVFHRDALQYGLDESINKILKRNRAASIEALGI